MKQFCRVCKSPDSILLFEIDNGRFMRCCNCTHVFLDSTHNEHSIKKMYETYNSGRGVAYFQGIDSETLHTIDLHLKSSRKYCRTNTTTLRLMDIGCGTGALLERAKKLGFDVEGTEICEQLSEDTSKRVGCTVHNNFLAQLPFPEESFDVITMYDLIEHLQDPVSDVEIVCKLLKTGGIVFILCPNDNALIRKLSKLAYGLSFHYITTPMQILYYQDHLSYFTRKSLMSLLKKCGFEVVFFETRNQELGRLQLSPLLRFLVRFTFYISRYFANVGGKYVVYARKK